MARPIILTVDDDVTVSQAITRDLRSRYADRYRIVRATSGAEALATLDELTQRDLQVALIVSDHRMPRSFGSTPNRSLARWTCKVCPISTPWVES